MSQTTARQRAAPRGLVQALSTRCAAQMVQREYEELYGSQLQTVHPVYKPTRMSKLCKEYNKLRVKMLDTCDTYELRMRKNKKIKRKTVRLPPPASHWPWGSVRAACGARDRAWVPCPGPLDEGVAAGGWQRSCWGGHAAV